MAWDKTKPAGNVGINLGDDAIRANNEWIEDALTEAIEFPGTFTTRGWVKGRQYSEIGRDALSPVDRMWILNSTRGSLDIYDSGLGSWVSYDFAMIGEMKLLPFDISSPPDAWLAADGDEYSETTYADLFAAIGTTFNNNPRYSPATPSGGNFRLPDMRGRSPYGVLAAHKQLVDEEFIPYIQAVPGLDDATYGGTYTGTSTREFQARIITTGSPDNFKWSNDGGQTWSGNVAITGAAQTLANGVEIIFLATTGHTINDTWVITAEYVDDFAVLGATADKTNLRLLPHHIPSHSHRKNRTGGLSDPGHSHTVSQGFNSSLNGNFGLRSANVGNLATLTALTATTGLSEDIDYDITDHDTDGNVIRRRSNALRVLPPGIVLEWAIYAGI